MSINPIIKSLEDITTIIPSYYISETYSRNRYLDKKVTTEGVKNANLIHIASPTIKKCETFTSNFTKGGHNKSIYLGNVDLLSRKYKNYITGIDNSSDLKLEDIKKIYFDPYCTFPRYKLKEKTSIIRTIDPKNADVIVINGEAPSLYAGYYKSKNNIILYKSASTNELFHLDNSAVSGTYYKGRTSVHSYISNSIHFEFRTANIANSLEFFKCIFPQALEVISEEFLETHNRFEVWLEFLKIKGHLPQDTEIYYIGSYDILEKTKGLKVAEVLENDLYSNKTIITTEILDKLLNESANIKEPTIEELNAIDNMLASQDKGIVEMALKMLNSYNMYNHIGSLVIMLHKNAKTILPNKGRLSVAYRSTLANLGILEYEKSILSIPQYSNQPNQHHNVGLLGVYTKLTNKEQKLLLHKYIWAAIVSEIDTAVKKILSTYKIGSILNLSLDNDIQIIYKDKTLEDM